jgi:hypothetical protein
MVARWVLAIALISTVSTTVARADAPRPLTFAVLSDLHISATAKDELPPGAARMISALVAMRPRFVVITGDFTNGNVTDSPGQVRFRAHAWRAIRRLLLPLRTAGIPVLPIAGNHDAYLDGQRRLYAQAFADLDQWAAPIAIIGAKQPAGGKLALDAAPFSYAVDVDGVHLALAHVVDQHVSPAFSKWLAGDLTNAKAARMRIVFGHVPVWSIITRPNQRFAAILGALLVAGHADAYIAGHEHLAWDEQVALPGGRALREILVGTATGRYDYGPNPEEMKHAACVKVEKHEECKLPIGGERFDMIPGSHKRWREDQRATLTMITIDGQDIHATPIGIDNKTGRLEAFK